MFATRSTVLDEKLFRMVFWAKFDFLSRGLNNNLGGLVSSVPAKAVTGVKCVQLRPLPRQRVEQRKYNSTLGTQRNSPLRKAVSLLLQRHFTS